ncbi:hypothetical protein [Streptomyces sp. Ncost-T10-10d]|nr:hypothetical protein [Streptomyces sp. Ncost-T10-10d]
MSSDVRLTSVEADSARPVLTVERLGADPLIAFVAADADTWLGT